jgi:hypothetical protein
METVTLTLDMKMSGSEPKLSAMTRMARFSFPVKKVSLISN